MVVLVAFEVYCLIMKCFIIRPNRISYFDGDQSLSYQLRNKVNAIKSDDLPEEVIL